MGSRAVAAAVLLAAGCLLPGVAASTCYGVGDVVGSVIGTLVVTLLIVALVLYARRYFQRRKGKNRPLTSDRPDSEFGAFVNPNFQDDEFHPAAPTLNDAERGEIPVDSNKGNSTLENKNQTNAAKQKKGKPSKTTLLGNLKNGKNHKQRALDDSCINLGPEKITVPLRGIDFTGLGFNVCGNMRDGIFIKDVLHRGPAMESGKIKAGDRILNLTVSFTNMVYEDALTILSYASPYDVQLEIQKMPETSHIPGHQKKGSNASNMSGFGAGDRHSLYHPLYRSQSIGDLSKIGREDVANKRSLSVGGPTKVVKRDGFVKTSHSLREEGTTDLNSSISNPGSATQSLNEKVHVQASASLDSLDGDPRQSRFKVQKVSEADEDQISKSQLGPDGPGAVSRRKSSSDSCSSAEGGEHDGHQKVQDSPVTQPISFSPNELYSPFGKAENALQTKSTDAVQDANISYVTRDQDARSQSSELSVSLSEDDPVLGKMDLINLDSGSPKTDSVPARKTSVPGKRKAPAPPPAGSSEPWLDTGETNVTVVSTDAQHVTTLKVSPDIHDVPSWVSDAGNNVGTKGIQTNFSSSEGENSESESEVERDAETGAIAKKPAKSKKEEKENRRASSLGDLTRVKEAGQKGFPLERSVSMDFNHTEAHLVDGQLGVQREQIKTKLAMVDENAGENGMAPLKKHFGASENLHLDNSYLESWGNLEKSHSREKIDGTTSEDEDAALMELDAAVMSKSNGNGQGSVSSESSGELAAPALPKSPVPELAQVPNDDMSDVSLSDREMDMSDASSSLSDDSLGGKKHRSRKKHQQQPEKSDKPVIKKMIPLDHTINLSQLPSSSSESGSDDEAAGDAMASNDRTKGANIDQEDSRKPPHIWHDSSTGSSMVTIGPPQVTQAWEKAPPVNTDPEMSKIFNNITVSNVPKNPITLDIDSWTIISDDNKNGVGGRDEGGEEHNGNGSASPNVDRQYEATLEMDVSGQKDVDNKFGLISFESTPPGPQKPGDNKYSNFTVSEGGVSRAMIISNPQLAPVPYDHRELESPPTLQPLE